MRRRLLRREARLAEPRLRNPIGHSPTLRENGRRTPPTPRAAMDEWKLHPSRYGLRDCFIYDLSNPTPDLIDAGYWQCPEFCVNAVPG